MATNSFQGMIQKQGGLRRLTQTQQQGLLRQAAKTNPAVRRGLTDPKTSLTKEEQRSAFRAVREEQKKREVIERTIVKGREEAVARRAIAERNRLWMKTERIKEIQEAQTLEQQHEKRVPTPAAKAPSDDIRQLANKARDLPI